MTPAGETPRLAGAAVTQASDGALARRAGLGDTTAFEELFSRLFVPTLRYALHMLDGDEQLAEDAVQESWIKAWRGLPEYRGESAVQTWLFTIVAHEVLNLRRRRRPLPLDSALLDAPLAKPSTVVDPPQTLLDAELWKTLQMALSELPWRQRASWHLREMDGLSYDEIARVLNTTPTVVRGQLHRARRALAIRMEQWR